MLYFVLHHILPYLPYTTLPILNLKSNITPVIWSLLKGNKWWNSHEMVDTAIVASHNIYIGQLPKRGMPWSFVAEIG